MIGTPLMRCGHAANATRNGEPVCVICIGINPGATTPADPPDLDGREALCIYCGRTTPSTTRLAFFEHRPCHDQDRYYDGCFGWD